MNPRQRGAYKLYWGALLAYAVLLPAAVWLTKHHASWRGKPLFMVFPLITICLVLRAMAIYFAEADEMQRRILSEGCAYAFATTVFVTVACGFFEGSSIPFIPWSVRFAFMMFTWGIATRIVKARYK